MDLSKYSVISTNVEFDSDNNVIRKTYKKNLSIDITSNELKELIDAYILLLRDSKISIPTILNSHVDGDFVIYESKYCGKNIIELGFNILNFDTYIFQITKMLEIVKLAINNDIYFDPHPKNFVFDDNCIYYVDFFPPYNDYIKHKRLSVAKTNEIQIISENFQFFTKEFLIEHFCGDFLNIDQNAERIFESIYTLSKDMGLCENSFEEFTKKAKYIRDIEDERLKKGIFLL